MIKAKVFRRDLKFIVPGQTSRGTLYSKPSWFFVLEKDGNTGIGECSVIPGLNPDYNDGYESIIHEIVAKINSSQTLEPNQLESWPSIRFGLETALIDLDEPKNGILFPSAFTSGDEGIPINGLIWMGSREEMKKRIGEKLKLGFRVLKLKIGALEFEEELSLLRQIRAEYSAGELELRLDANGAFKPHEAIEKLNRISDFTIHSIEQPIAPGQWETMADICEKSPIDVALDEELIGISASSEKHKLLKVVQPNYIILKPSLLGGLSKSMEWINLAEETGVGHWVTSALESNVGLNAIAQWAFTLKSDRVQGLGTGRIFSNNFPSPLELRGSELFYNPEANWQIDFNKFVFSST